MVLLEIQTYECMSNPYITSNNKNVRFCFNFVCQDFHMNFQVAKIVAQLTVEQIAAQQEVGSW